MSFSNLLKKIFTSPRPASRFYEFQVQCNRCGETLDGRVDLYNDPSLEFEDGKEFYFCRKVLMGSGSCFQRVETNFKFNENRDILEKKAVGGEFLEE